MLYPDIHLHIILPDEVKQREIVEAHIRDLINSMDAKKIEIRRGTSTEDPVGFENQATTFILFWLLNRSDILQWPLWRITPCILKYQAFCSLPSEPPPALDEIKHTLAEISEYADAASWKNPGLCFHALKLIDEQYSDLDLKHLAEQLEVNSSYLCRVLSENTGCSFLNLLHCRRLLSAIHTFAWSDDNCSVEETALAAGYTSVHYFHRVFRRYLGISPAWARRILHHQS